MTLFAALVLVALVPAVGVLWFMSVAMRNERLAVQERLATAYSNHLASLQQHATAFVQERQTALRIEAARSPRENFAALIRANLADGAVIGDAAGRPLYPTAANPATAAAERAELPPGSAAPATTPTGQARTLQTQAAELLQDGKKDEVLAKLAELVGDARLRNAVGAEGTLIVPNAQLLILKMLAPVGRALSPTNPSEVSGINPNLHQTLQDLVTRLNDYSDAAMSSSQRRFLMAEVSGINPDLRQYLDDLALTSGNAARAPRPQELQTKAEIFPTFAAEVLAADYLEHEPASVLAGVADRGRSPLNATEAARASALSPSPPQAKPPAGQAFERTPLAKVWRLSSASPGHRIIALYREARLRAELEKYLEPFVLPDVRVSVLAPNSPLTAQSPGLSLEAGEFLPGWRLALDFRNGDPLAEASARQTRFYLSAGVGAVAIIALLALLIARYVSAQMRLARMKNELVSTVSHELKTPLASMRALVDTLLADRCRDADQRREYLQLIAKENLRLSHLIENFLTFSRLERGQQRFEFEPARPEAIVNTAIDALADRLTGADCDFTMEIAPDLPAIRADADALATVLVNLLDNACKYTPGHKRITLRVRAAADAVVFEVTDNGVGIEARETRRIFARFYQVDQSLTRTRGGCGLGLSIVDAIVKAHGGSIEVESERGRGSTFRVRIPTPISLGNREAAAVALKPVNRGLGGLHG